MLMALFILLFFENFIIFLAQRAEQRKILFPIKERLKLNVYCFVCCGVKWFEQMSRAVEKYKKKKTTKFHRNNKRIIILFSSNNNFMNNCCWVLCIRVLFCFSFFLNAHHAFRTRNHKQLIGTSPACILP